MKRKYKVLAVIAVLTLLPLLFFSLREEKTAQIFFGEDMSASAEANDVGAEYISEPFRLTPGIYHLQAKMLPSDEGSIFTDLTTENSAYHALLFNGFYIWAAQETATVDVYVLAPINDLQLHCTFANMEVTDLDSISFLYAASTYRVLFTILAACYLLLALLFWFRDGCISGKISRSAQIVTWSLIGLSILAYFPYLHDYFNLGADTAYHVTRIRGLADAIASGQQFPIRLSEYYMFDHGYATSLFYADFFLLFPALLKLIGFPIITSYKIFLVAVCFGTALITYFSFYHCVRRPYVALFGTTVYMTATYRIFNVFERGAVGEFLAMMCFPLIMCGMYRLYTDDIKDKSYRKNKWFLIWGLSGVIQSHVLSCEMSAIFILLVCLIYIKRTFRKETFLQLAETVILTLLINCWFWLPFVYMMYSDTYLFHNLTESMIQWQGITIGKLFQTVPYKGVTHLHIYQTDPMQLGAATDLVLLIFPVVLIKNWKQRHKNPYTRVCITLFCLTLLSVFMATTYFPWDAIAKVPVLLNLVTALQFPTRMMSPAAALGSMLALFFIPWFEQEVSPRLLKQSVAVIAFLAVGSGIFQVNNSTFIATPVRLYTLENMGYTRAGNGEYLLTEGAVFEEYSFHLPIPEEGLTFSNYKKEGLDITLTVENTTDKTLNLQLPLIGYQGYRVDADSLTASDSNTLEAAAPAISDELGTHSDLLVSIPAHYQGNLHIYYNSLPLFRIAEWTSWITLIILLFFFIKFRFHSVSIKKQ